MIIEPGVFVAIFVAIIGSYGFTFVAWRGISNHVYTKLDKLQKDLAANHLEVTNRLTALETAFRERKE